MAGQYFGGVGAQDKRMVIRFVMPSTWTMATLPEPNDGRVRLVEVPAETVAVLRFTGDVDGQFRRRNEVLGLSK